MTDMIVLLVSVVFVAALVAYAVSVLVARKTAGSQTWTGEWACSACERPVGNREDAYEHAREVHNAPPDGDAWQRLYEGGL